ncbi:MAG: 4'-phosphopantetheinyl transferase superfamily protein [Gammaproteobacteria bacterium]|nr:4'-phosphopantetheinyl transferase superfamily protein [Gammaproteobacteria bacterium]
MNKTKFVELASAGMSFTATGEVHLWKIDLSELHWPSRCPQVLDTGERERYAGFRFARDASRFALRRAALRQILGGYLGVNPCALVFETADAAGKPCLSAPQMDELRFNASSSEDISLVAVALDSAIGIDVEAMRPDIVSGIAERFFTAAELARLLALPGPKRISGFYRLWTSKEALLKAVGTGLPGGLERFEVGADPDRPPELVRDAEGPPSLFLYPTDPAPGYCGALALDRPDAEITEFAFPITGR